MRGTVFTLTLPAHAHSPPHKPYIVAECMMLSEPGTIVSPVCACVFCVPMKCPLCVPCHLQVFCIVEWKPRQRMYIVLVTIILRMLTYLWSGMS